MLLLQNREQHDRVTFDRQNQNNRPFGGTVGEAGQVGDPYRVENDGTIKAKTAQLRSHCILTLKELFFR
jgi:hypothetical protein